MWEVMTRTEDTVFQLWRIHSKAKENEPCHNMKDTRQLNLRCCCSSCVAAAFDRVVVFFCCCVFVQEGRIQIWQFFGERWLVLLPLEKAK